MLVLLSSAVLLLGLQVISIHHRLLCFLPLYCIVTVIESLRLERPVRSPSPTPAHPTTPTHHIPQCHISTALKHLQGQRLHQLSGQQPVPSSGTSQRTWKVQGTHTNQPSNSITLPTNTSTTEGIYHIPQGSIGALVELLGEKFFIRNITGSLIISYFISAL